MRTHRRKYLEAQPKAIDRHGDVRCHAQAQEHSQEFAEAACRGEHGGEEVTDSAGGVAFGPGGDGDGRDGEGGAEALKTGLVL